MWKRTLGHRQTEKAQFSLQIIHAVSSMPLLSKIIYSIHWFCKLITKAWIRLPECILLPAYYGLHQVKTVPSNTHRMCIFRSSYACAMYHLGLCSSFIHSVVSNDSVSKQWKPCSDCPDAQADLGFYCPCMPEDAFSLGKGPYGKRAPFLLYANICDYWWPRHSYAFVPFNQYIHHLFNPSLAEHDMPCFSKQCRSRSVGFCSEEANWSGSALFVIKYVNSYQKPRSSNLIGWKLEVGVAS